MKIIIEENHTRIRLTSKVINHIQNNNTFTFNKDNTNGFLNLNINITLADSLTISKESNTLNIALDQKTINFISQKENKKQGLPIKTHNISLQLDLDKQK